MLMLNFCVTVPFMNILIGLLIATDSFVFLLKLRHINPI